MSSTMVISHNYFEKDYGPFIGAPLSELSRIQNPVVYQHQDDHNFNSYYCRENRQPPSVNQRSRNYHQMHPQVNQGYSSGYITHEGLAAPNYGHINVAMTATSGGGTIPVDDTESVKYRQLPCRTFISAGTCPYRDRCVYLHDPRIMNLNAKTKTRKKNKDDGFQLDSFFWPVMSREDVSHRLDDKNTPHVVQPYHLPIPTTTNLCNGVPNDLAIYSMWNYFVSYFEIQNNLIHRNNNKRQNNNHPPITRTTTATTTTTTTSTSAAAVTTMRGKEDQLPTTEDPSNLINIFTKRKRLAVFIQLADSNNHTTSPPSNTTTTIPTPPATANPPSFSSPFPLSPFSGLDLLLQDADQHDVDDESPLYEYTKRSSFGFNADYFHHEPNSPTSPTSPSPLSSSSSYHDNYLLASPVTVLQFDEIFSPRGVRCTNNNNNKDRIQDSMVVKHPIGRKAVAAAALPTPYEYWGIPTPTPISPPSSTSTSPPTTWTPTTSHAWSPPPPSSSSAASSSYPGRSLFH